MRLEPNNGTNYLNLATAYENLNRLDEAEAVYKQAEEHKLVVDEGLLQDRYLLAFLEGDTAQMLQLAAAAIGKPGKEDLLLASQADTEAWHGKLKNAREFTRRAMVSAQRNDAKETAASYQVSAALREVVAGDRQQARDEATEALKLSQTRDVKAMAALALAQAGDTEAAEKLAGELDKTFPLNTLVQRYWLPTIRAAVALERKDPNRAVELLKQTRPVDLAAVNTGINVFLCPVYLRGEAFLMLHDGKAAGAEFQKFVDHYGLLTNFPWGALARLGLARAYALDAATDPSAREKARTVYQNFLALWKDADPDIPIYKQAKAEYARLQ
jgi:eukaryotic-like serine/threonine-protein kinase